jgi:hypothetical protein
MVYSLALTLLETRVPLVDDVPLPLADHDLAILGTSLDAALNFHGSVPLSGLSLLCLPAGGHLVVRMDWAFAGGAISVNTISVNTISVNTVTGGTGHWR